MAIDNECSPDDSPNSFDTVASKPIDPRRKHANHTSDDLSIFNVSLVVN
jgi:hypothetical protein